MLCPSCKAELADGMKFCTQCGTKLEAEKIPSTQGSTEPRQASQVQEPASPIKQQPLQPQPPTAASQPAAQPQIQQQRPQQQKKQKQSKSDVPKKTGPVPFIALGVSVIALILAIVGFVLPKTTQPATPVTTNTPKVIAADTTTIKIKAGETTGITKILGENTPYIVVATAVGGDSTFCDVMYSQEKGELRIIAKNAVEKDTTRDVMWVAYEK